MKLILAVGPTPAQAETVWHWLQQQGVLPAKPSRREQLSPDALSALMTKTQRPAPTGAAAPQHQHKLWAELAADLFLANVDQPFWGWSQPLDDAQLAFWLDFDPSTQLAMGYTSPQEALRLLLQDDQLPSDAQVDEALRQWHGQHSQLLTCHYQHRPHSVLIHTQVLVQPHGATASARALLQTMGLTRDPQSSPEEGAAADAVAPPTVEQQLEASLLNRMLARLPEAVTLYQELEAVAHWPLAEPLEAPEPPSVPALWQALRKSQSLIAQAEQERQTLRNELANTLKAEQVAREQEQADWTQKLYAAEQALSTEKTTLAQRLQAAEVLIKPAQAQIDAQQHQLKELTEENDLLLAQLHQVQEELEHYFLQLKDARQTHQAELAPLNFECGFWRRHAPAEVWVDLRQDIAGNGWFEAEADGRWTGPELTSALNLPPLAPGLYTLELHLADAIQPELVSGLTLQAVRHDGTLIQPIELLHEFGAGPSLYPMVSMGSLQLPALEGSWALQLSLPFNVSPADTGGADTRRLGVRVQGLRLSVNEAEVESDPRLHDYVEADAHIPVHGNREPSAETR